MFEVWFGTLHTHKPLLRREPFSLTTAMQIRQLADFPEIGAPLSSIINLQVPYRFLVCGNYTAFYKVEGDEVHIIRVLYGRRNFMQMLFGKSYDE